jgi:multicomponent Na+:H+ antiporter subunit E
MRMINKPSLPWSSYAFRCALYILVWWILTDGVAASWWIGIPAIVLALMTSLYLLPPVAPAWSRWISFIPFFISRSLYGGIDVARRAFHPNLPLTPAIIEYRLRLPEGLAQVFLINIINLLPGTLCASVNQNVVQIHVLDSGQDFMSELILVEEVVSGLFGIQLHSQIQGKPHAAI